MEGINATDNIAVRSYRISISSGTTLVVYPENLTSTVLIRGHKTLGLLLTTS